MCSVLLTSLLVFPWQGVDATLEARATTVSATSVVAGLGTVEMEA